MVSRYLALKPSTHDRVKQQSSQEVKCRHHLARPVDLSSCINILALFGTVEDTISLIARRYIFLTFKELQDRSTDWEDGSDIRGAGKSHATKSPKAVHSGCTRAAATPTSRRRRALPGRTEGSEDHSGKRLERNRVRNPCFVGIPRKVLQL